MREDCTDSIELTFVPLAVCTILVAFDLGEGLQRLLVLQSAVCARVGRSS